MEKENTAQDSKNAAQGADARRETGAAANLGKFKSVDALLNAYNSLEAEFTRRSQALRELEERERAAKAAREEEKNGSGERAEHSASPAPFKQGGTEPPRGADTVSDGELAEKIKKIAEEYFAARETQMRQAAATRGSAQGEFAPIILAEGGSFSAAPAPRVRSFEEAGKLAADLFRKNG
ncbi:MAG TPA: hypothetical protein H9731_00945 [Candidatus Borkfalkia excrementipullorum]|nr:hypothetical protein [Candidatus Borkfalkia excrementipullorum]